MSRGLALLERIKGLSLTILHDTCSGSAPYESLPAGVSLTVQGMIWDETDSRPEGVTVFFGLNSEDDAGDLTLTLAEVFEVTNLLDLVDFHDKLAAASGEAASPFRV